MRSLNEHESDSISVSSGSANAGPSFESETSISANDEFELMKNLCEVLFQQKRYAELQRVAFSSLGSRIFNKKEEIIKEVEFLCLISAFLNKGQAHDMFSRIFRIWIYEFFILCTIYINVSYVIEFLAWWVLKSKFFAQNSTANDTVVFFELTQKVGLILESKVVQKLSLEKSVFNKK